VDEVLVLAQVETIREGVMTGKEKWFDIIDDFITVQSFITLGAYGTVFYLTWTKIIPPETVIGFTGTLMGYWFGKQQAQAGGQK
jgi:hypothetical protein